MKKVKSPPRLTIVFDSTKDGVCSSDVEAGVTKTVSWQEAESKDGVQISVDKETLKITDMRILPEQDIPTIAIIAAKKYGLR